MTITSTGNWFLQLKLREAKIFAYGTVNSRRKFLLTLKNYKHLQKGEHDYRINDTKVSFLIWKDKRSVFILSNCHDPKNVGKVKRRERDGTSVEMSCPEAVNDYNANMNFVDIFDQLKESYAVDRKSHNLFTPRPMHIDTERIQTKRLPGSTGASICQRQRKAEVILSIGYARII